MLFLLFRLFLSFFLERRRSQSQVIIKIKAQQIQQTALQTKYWSTNFSDWLTHKVQTTTMTPVDLPWWCDWGEVFTHSLDNSSSPDPETHTDPNTSIKQQPDGSWCFLHYSSLLVDKPECHEGTNGIAGETQAWHLSYKNAHSCLGRSILFLCDFSSSWAQHHSALTLHTISFLTWKECSRWLLSCCFFSSHFITDN